MWGDREREKRAKYQGLAADLARQSPGWSVRVFPVVLGDLSTIGSVKAYLTGTNVFWPVQVDNLVGYM